ncbi:lipopolysaccharide assembly protein LapB [Idiomarina seosinensis]|uniref:Lipopolysaccharide assembly protein B n=1 Tax=Idiomarina seosinensis TaxID=281739 RepID=A0A432ZI52_9GAMM|nr:lipopolysaccharide assembly protein LapB [Idiomarina seosinensis]RUO77628.1 lipopolysaccharide assembly protein LapB [Idiomarina seosinensis]
MLELLFLLLPVAAAYGWFMGRNSVRSEERKEQQRFSKQYATGLNLLLSDQPDKAVDLFVELLDVDSDTLETHWTLGKLFRRRGEVERAIKIHQNLTSRPNIAENDRLTAMYELGKDYLAAGIYDRAEQMFSGLQQHKVFREKSRKNLLELFQATHEWDKAIKVALRLTKDDRSVEAVVAQLFCELADNEQHVESAIKHYKKALKHDPRCVRASISLGQLYSRQGQRRVANNYYEKVLQQDKSFVCEVLKPLEQCYREQGDMLPYIEFLQHCVEQDAGTSATIALSEYIFQTQGGEAAERFIRTSMETHPTMRGFHQLMDFHIRAADVGNARESLKVLQTMVAEHISQRPKYSCRHCGFAGHTLYWQCPSCKSWSTTKPIIGLDGE